MLFTESRFLLFFLVVLAVHWGLRGARARKGWLLLASYLFYAGWDARFLALILLSTAVDYACGLAMGREVAGDRPPASPEALARLRRARRPWLILSVVTNLGLLGTFKYFDFFAASAARFASWLGFEPSALTLGVVLPVGISFYTFQTMSYTIDVYRGRLRPARDALDFALFVAFFPQLVAGPIVRASDFLPQLEGQRRFREHVAVRASLVLFLVGFFKKACLADGIAPVVAPVFADPTAFGTGANWTAVVLYHVQIYGDFSGYSDMAIATAGLLGYRLPLNFDFPYFASTIGEFWRRWHMSLSSWLRDYLYFPLVGRRAGLLRQRLALFGTLALCGLWHGAGWNYVLFGMAHGLWLVLGELVPGRSAAPGRSGPRGRGTALVGWAAVALAVLLTWPVFRADGMQAVGAMYGALLGFGPVGEGTLPGVAWAVILGAALVHRGFQRGWGAAHLRALPSWAFAALYGFLWSMTLPWVADDAAPFIYFQF